MPGSGPPAAAAAAAPFLAGRWRTRPAPRAALPSSSSDSAEPPDGSSPPSYPSPAYEPRREGGAVDAYRSSAGGSPASDRYAGADSFEETDSCELY